MENKKTPAEWAADGSAYDCTSWLGSLNSDKPWAMYSYERPAYIFWNGVAKALNARGWSDLEIQTWLQSKNPRWLLDGQMGDTIESLGELVGSTATKLTES